jgi:integrase
MSVRKEGDRYRADFMLNKVRYRELFDTKQEAEAYEAQARLDHSRGKPVTQPHHGRSTGPIPRTIGPFVGYVRKVHWDHRGRKSAAKLSRNAEMFAEFLGPAMAVADALTYSSIQSYTLYMKDTRKNSGDTINRHLASIQVLARVAKAERLIAERPEIQLHEPAASRDRVVSEKEEAALLAYLLQSGRQKEWDLTVFLIDVGSRFGETLKLEWEQVDLKQGRIQFLGSTTKTNKGRTVLMTDRVEKMLRARRSRPEGSGDGVFADVNYWGFGEYWSRTRSRLKFLKDVHIHDLRHTCLTRLARAGLSAFDIMKWAGHTSIITSQKYVNLSVDDLKNAREVLNRYGKIAAKEEVETHELINA